MTPKLVELPGFEEAVARHKWTGTRLPALYTGRRPCLKCTAGEVLELGPVTNVALFFLGGYGGSVVTTFDLCLACGSVNLRRSETARPPRRNLTG